MSMTGSFGLFVRPNCGSISRGLALFWFGHDVLCLGNIEYKNVQRYNSLEIQCYS